jgi:hypothetical protein
MAHAKLTPAQRRAADPLVAKHRLAMVPGDAASASTFLGKAKTRIVDLPNVTMSENKYSLAYDACHDVGKALLAAYGYKPTNGLGQHETVSLFLKAVLDKPLADAAARRFDILRNGRNKLHYSFAPIGAADATIAATKAQELYDAALKRGVGT